MNVNELETIRSEVKRVLLIERLDLEDITEEEITNDMILFYDGLGLDSVEAFEIIVGLEEMYGVTFEGIPAEEIREKLTTVDSIVHLIQKKRTRETSA